MARRSRSAWPRLNPAKAAIRDVGRVLELPYSEVDKVAKLVPNTLNITLDEAISAEPRLSASISASDKIQEVIDLARALEGQVRHASTHAAGVVISDEPLNEHVPLYRGSKGEVVTQYAKDDLEKIGLIKFDFLGLRSRSAWPRLNPATSFATRITCS